MNRGDLRLRTEEVRRTELHPRRAERQGGDFDPTCRRRFLPRRSPEPHRIDDLGNQRDRPDWRRRRSRNVPRCPPASAPCAMIASHPRSEPASLLDGGRRGEHLSRRSRDGRARGLRGKAEVEAHHRGRNSSTQIAGAARRTGRATGGRPACRGRAQLDVVRREALAPPRVDVGVARSGAAWQKKLRLSDRDVAARNALDLAADSRRASSIAHGSDPSPPASRNRDRELPPASPPSAPGRSEPRCRRSAQSHSTDHGRRTAPRPEVPAAPRTGTRGRGAPAAGAGPGAPA